MPPISVIIPTLNEARDLAATLSALELCENDQLIVADGGSADGTAAAARRAAARVVTSMPGRARQMNAGAAVATGEVLLFVHADTRLPRGGLDAVRRGMRDEATVGGAFRLGIDAAASSSRGAELSLRIVAFFANLRSRWLGLPYGDQALFVRRAVFERLGGFADAPIMEDVDFVRRLRRAGRVVILPQRVATSARRWRGNGVWRTTWTNWRAMLMYRRGRPLEEIRAFYDRKLKRGGDSKPTGGVADPRVSRAARGDTNSPPDLPG